MAVAPSHHPLKPPTRNSTLRALSDSSADDQTGLAHHLDPEHAHGNLDAHPPTPPDAPVTAPLPTPHDAVLAELHGTRPDGGSHSVHKHHADISRHAPRLSVIPSVGSLERTATPSAALPRSATSTPGAAHDQLFDPFSGNVAGIMVSKKDTVERDLASQFDQRRDELWARLSSIRELQSEVAGLHVQMEGIGLNDMRGGKRAAGVGARMHTDAISVVVEEWDEPDGAADAVEEQRKRARDAEFTNLAETFKGRREAIDAIMNKLGDLSEALTTFHDLPTPVMGFASSRANTKESMPTSTSPDGEPRSPSTAASPSPEPPVALPKFVLSEADKGVLHDSPIAAPGELPLHAPPA